MSQLDRPGEPSRHLEPKLILGVFALILISLCLVGFVSIRVINWYATQPGSGLPALLCAGIATAPRVQVGFTWDTPISSRTSPLVYSPLAGCTTVPSAWLPGYSQYWLLPP